MREKLAGMEEMEGITSAGCVPVPPGSAQREGPSIAQILGLGSSHGASDLP